MFKKIDNSLLVVGVIVVALALVYAFAGNLVSPFLDKSNTTQISTPTQVTSENNFVSNINDTSYLTEALMNSEVIVPGVTPEVKVKLVGGQGTYKDGENLQEISFISVIGKNLVLDGNYDVFASYGANLGGSGTFVYVGLNHVTSDKITYTSQTDFLGDRIKVKSATASAANVNSYGLVIDYLDRELNDPMSEAPSVPASKEFEVKENIIVN